MQQLHSLAYQMSPYALAVVCWFAGLHVFAKGKDTHPVSIHIPLLTHAACLVTFFCFLLYAGSQASMCLQRVIKSLIL